MCKIKNLNLEVPVIQGGMGIGVSLGNLAGAVAACGGMGVISTVNAGYREDDFEKNPLEANLRALKKEILHAKEISNGKGIVAINAMVAVNNYEESIKAAIEAGVEAVISGAGLPLNLPDVVKGTDVAIAPIVSSGKAARVICRGWDKHYGVAPDFIIIEGPMAGGHLGFSREELLSGTAKSIDEILPEVLKEIAPYEEKYQRTIPVFVAGGVFDGHDMAHFIQMGASGVQIATRFIATKECDASDKFKEMIINSKEEDICIIHSPVGMPGHALNSPLIQRLNNGGELAPTRCNLCLKACPHGDKTPYCISRALIEAVKGNTEDGLFFCGSNAYRINKLTTVSELFEEIIKEYNKKMLLNIS